MLVEILGAHTTEAASAKPTSLLIDRVIAVDAGALCSSLSLEAQRDLTAVLLTHHHFDHVRDIPLLCMNVAGRATVRLYCTADTFRTVYEHLLDGELYPDFVKWPETQPALEHVPVTPGRPFSIGDYEVLGLPAAHGVPTVGYQVSCPDGKKVLYTGDTGPGLAPCWERVHPDLLIIEVSMPDRMEELALRATHLTPRLLEQELAQFRSMNGYLPPTVVIHMGTAIDEEISSEIAGVAAKLEADIAPGWEGMSIGL